MEQQEIVARCRPVRMMRAPVECRAGQQGFTGPCWIETPYEAVRNAVGGTPRCLGCNGRINPNGVGNPSADEIRATLSGAA